MASPAYIFCKWKSRFWPAKVLTEFKQPLPKSSKLKVEIFEENKQTSVEYSNTKPFLMAELKKISETLDRSENLKVTVQELCYRRALGTAMDLLKKVSARETALSHYDRNATTFETCRQAVKHVENECSSSRRPLIQKEASDSSLVDERITLKRGKDSCLKASSMPRVHTRSHIKDAGDKRKRDDDTSKGQDHFPVGKKAATKIVSLISSTVKKHTSGTGKIRRGRFNSPLSSAREIQNVPSRGQDEDNLRKGNPRPKRLIRQPTKKDNVQVATSIPQVGSGKEEIDSCRKCKYDQLPLPEFGFTEPDFSSELSMEFSSPESSTIPNTWPNDDTEEDVQLPVIALKEPTSFECGAFVWCKFQRYPYWPSLITLIRNKEKRVSIIFVEECLSDPKSQKKSFRVSLHTLKHYECPEKQELLDIARKDYGKSVDWCDALISDYRIRLGCGSFSGPFLDYCTSAISYPVRKECSNTRLNFPSICPKICDLVPDNRDSDSCVKKKILPDRSRASRDRANEKLVQCIVKNRQAEGHLINILTGKKKSLWLKKFQLSNQRVECLETYIEDEKQAEQLVGYLQMLCEKKSRQSKKLMCGDQTKFILEVMFPEAVICAISATEGLSYEKAQKKFLEGPLLSKRERKLFEKQILEKKIKPKENL